VAERRVVRYLSRADVQRCLPPIGGQIDLAEEALLALTRDTAEVPALIGVHPRDDAFLHAMPAWDKMSDIVGIKWVSHYPLNPTLGLPAVSGLVVINDAETGLPVCIMDGTEITARRTAAVSGAAVRLFAPLPASGHQAGAGVGRVAGSRERGPAVDGVDPCAGREGQRTYAIGFVGAGNQARMHLEMLVDTIGRVRVRAYDAVSGRAEAFVEEAAHSRCVAAAAVAEDAAAACRDADIVVSVASSRTLGQKVVTPDMLTPHCLVLTVDWAIMLTSSLGQDAGLFLVDDLVQFTQAREGTEQEWFTGYPRAHGSLGRALLAAERIATSDAGGGTPGADASGGPVSRAPVREAVAAALGGRADGRILVATLGVGAVDIVTAGAVYRVALQEGVGRELPA